ncbi:MAG: zinc metallopeptidase [Ruminococcaceae bacterium]|nr:zinc metallopeptidase [Oscillospiraceae bacterium]
MFWFFDYWYIVLVLPAMILGIVAQIKVQSSYNKYSTVFSSRGYTASDVARRILDKNGLHSVRIERVHGELTDHFDPRDNVVRLSDNVYGSSSVAAIGVAAHEVGHAIQHARSYAPMKVRAAIIPVTRFGSTLAPILILLGFFLYIDSLAIFGIILYSSVALFQLVTLPVEFNASRRAMQTLEGDGILSRGEELYGARKVLSAAAMTYVTALIMSLAQILRLLLIFGGRRRD